MEYTVKVGLVTQWATTKVEAPDEVTAAKKAKRKIGDTTENTVVMQVNERGKTGQC